MRGKILKSRQRRHKRSFVCGYAYNHTLLACMVCDHKVIAYSYTYNLNYLVDVQRRQNEREKVERGQADMFGHREWCLERIFSKSGGYCEIIFTQNTF